MNDLLIKLTVKWQMLKAEDGQDLIEYALVVTIIAMGATASMGTVATAISNIFTHITTKITTSIT